MSEIFLKYNEKNDAKRRKNQQKKQNKKITRLP
jgi:hypothetical protein